MLKIATVFSGIGAIEHAIKRMGIEHKIVFACDNGDVDILSKKIDVDVRQIGTELDSLSKLINKIKTKNEDDITYKNELQTMLCRTIDEFSKLK